MDHYCNQVTVEYSGFDITWNETISGRTKEALCTGPGLNGDYCTYVCHCLLVYLYVITVLIQHVLQFV